MTVTSRDISEAVRNLGLSDKAVCIHSSLGSFGFVVGGADAVVSAFLNEGCTVMVPAFYSGQSIPPPPGQRPERNGWNYVEAVEVPYPRPIFIPSSNETDTGAIPEALLKTPGRVRGNHPSCSFAAVGPLSGDLISGQAPFDVYAPLGKLTELDGFVVLVGVGLNRMTFIHYAEQVAGRNLFRRWVVGLDGKPMMVEVGGCSEGFHKLEPVIRPLVRKIRVGKSLWQVFPAKETLDAVSRAIARDPYITHCGDAGCGRCNDAVLGGPILD
jgi:aminoglycoside N3'-acetyltransferase